MHNPTYAVQVEPVEIICHFLYEQLMPQAEYLRQMLNSGIRFRSRF